LLLGASFRSVGVMHAVGEKFGRVLDVESFELVIDAAPVVPATPRVPMIRANPAHPCPSQSQSERAQDGHSPPTPRAIFGDRRVTVDNHRGAEDPPRRDELRGHVGLGHLR
jgi:hypothetical protein